MAATRIRFYLDENIPTALGEQLRRRGVDAVTAREAGTLGLDDAAQLEIAATQGWVLCTHDSDFVELAVAGVAHSGIIIGQQSKHSIGDWVRFLELVYQVLTPEDMQGQIEFLV